MSYFSIYQALNGIYMVVSLASYPVQLMVVIDVMLSYIDNRFNERNLLLAEYGLRIVLVLLTCMSVYSCLRVIAINKVSR